MRCLWIALLLTPAFRLAAQRPTPAPALDSLQLNYVQEMLVEKAAPLIVRAARDTSRIALVMEFPTEDPTGRWRSLERVLMQAARGRAVRDTDSTRVVLTLNNFDTIGDSLTVVVTIAWEHRCEGAWLQTGYSYIRRLRLRQGWSSPLKPEETLAFDSFGCLPIDFD